MPFTPCSTDRSSAVPGLQGFNNVFDFTGWDCLASLHRLQQLDVRHCGLEAVPPLPPLPALSALDLSDNLKLRGGALPFFPARGGWHHLPPLAPSLASLSLQNTGMRLLPADLRTLSRLTHLDIRGSVSVVEGWRHLSPLTTLRSLQSAPRLADRLLLRSVPKGGRPGTFALWAADCANLLIFRVFPLCNILFHIFRAQEVPHESAIVFFLSAAGWLWGAVLSCFLVWRTEWS